MPKDAALGDAAPRCKDIDATLGTGVRSYIPVVDGDTVYLYRGPQGGYMIYLSVRTRDLDPADVSVCYTEAFSGSGVVFGKKCWRVRMSRALGDGWYERVGVWGEVDVSYWTLPGKIRGEDARVDVVLTDARGCSAYAGWAVHISEDPGM